MARYNRKLIQYNADYLYNVSTGDYAEAPLVKALWEAAAEPGDYDILTVLPKNTGAKRTVTYIAGFYLHSLCDSSDDTLSRLLFGDDGRPTAYFHSLVERLHREAPVLWDGFKWDEGCWNPPAGYLPRVLDADIEKWRAFDSDLPAYLVKQQNRIVDVGDFAISRVGEYSVYDLAYTPPEEL